MNHKKIINYIFITHAILTLILVFLEILSLKIGVLFFLAIGGLIMIIDRVLVPPLGKWLKKEKRKEQAFVDRQKLLAKNEGKTCFNRGANSQIVIWAFNKSHANKLFIKHFKVLEKANPNKDYYWISNKCNNKYK